MDTNTSMGAPKSNSKMITWVVVILLAIIALIFLVGRNPNNNLGTDQTNNNQAAESFDSQSDVSASDEMADIEAEIAGTNVEGVDAEVDSEFGDK